MTLSRSLVRRLLVEAGIKGPIPPNRQHLSLSATHPVPHTPPSLPQIIRGVEPSGQRSIVGGANITAQLGRHFHWTTTDWPLYSNACTSMRAAKHLGIAEGPPTGYPFLSKLTMKLPQSILLYVRLVDLAYVTHAGTTPENTALAEAMNIAHH